MRDFVVMVRYEFDVEASDAQEAYAWVRDHITIDEELKQKIRGKRGSTIARDEMIEEAIR